MCEGLHYDLIILYVLTVGYCMIMFISLTIFVKPIMLASGNESTLSKMFISFRRYSV